MGEEDVQGVGADRDRAMSLSDALRVQGIPVENHKFIRALTAAVGIDAYYPTSGYIKAVRADGGPDVRIAYGWSNGFVSAEEVTAVHPDAVPWTSPGRGHKLWGVSHPLSGAPSSDAPRVAARDRDYGICEVCWTTRAANGSCACE